MKNEPLYSVSELARLFCVTTNTIYRALDALGINDDPFFRSDPHNMVFAKRRGKVLVKKSKIPKVRKWLVENSKAKVS